ncbi:MAG TPA: MATE family efflux transporter [Lachnospiraceae bacterium]|nr:MATE family efflux transporter [Lachnospiraceae bacterium]
MVKDLTKGNVRPVLWSFTIPMFISVVFQQLYNIADSAIAGRFAGEDALAAVGASYPITMIFMAIAIGCNVGCAVVISSYFGAGDIRRMKTAISTTLIASTVLAAVLTIFGLLTSSYLMQMMNTPHNIFDAGDIYLKIYIGGMVFLFCYNVATGIFTALGDSKTPLYFLIGSSVGNVVLDYLFVAVFHFGVSGVGWATFLAQGIAGILAVVTLLRRVAKLPTGHGKVMLYSKSMLRRIAKIAVPSILQQSFVSVGNIFIQSLVNSFGSAVIAGYSAAVKLNTFTITSFSTLGNALSSFSAQNIGAAKIDRVRKGFRAGTMLAWIIAVPFFVLFFFFGNEMLRIFMENPTGGAMKAGMEFLKIVSPFYFIISVKLLADGLLRGSSAMIGFMVSTFTDLILRVILAYVFAGIFGSTGIWMSWPVGWSISAIISLLFYRYTWKQLSVERRL